jgi:hypothetical protein
MSSISPLLFAQAAAVHSTMPDGAARADLARGQRAYGRALAVLEEGSKQTAALLPRYGFARSTLPPDVLVFAEATRSEDPLPRATLSEARTAYGEAARRGRIDIPSGELLDLSV